MTQFECQGLGMGSPVASDALLLPRPSDDARPVCQVSNCQVLLHKPYDKKCRTCAAHRRALHVTISGQDARFCQKCGCFQLVLEYDGDKRSCRSRLSEHNKRQRRLRALRLKAAEGSGLEEDGQEYGSAASGSVEVTAPHESEEAVPVDDGLYSALFEPGLDSMPQDQLLDHRMVAVVQACLSEARQVVAKTFVPPLDDQFLLGSGDEDEALVWLGGGSDEWPSTVAITGTFIEGQSPS